MPPRAVCLASHDFVEIETPTLTRSTPEGARDFLVPARLQPGSFYALPQSPQLFKQLLMVAGMERYYQIARCYRDEDFRADRQPEFTQLDMEMSFVDADDVIAVSEEVLEALWALIGYDLPTPDPADDLRARRCAGSAPTSPTCGSASNSSSARSTSPTPRSGCSRRPMSARSSCRAARRSRGARSTAGRSSPSSAATRGWPTCWSPRTARSAAPSPRTSPTPNATAWPPTSARSRGTASSSRRVPAKSARALLGATRIEIAKRLDMIDPNAWAFTWVVDWPLFEAADEATASGDVAVGSGAWTAVHHAFTSPKPESEATFDTDPGSALANAYDIVCNGNEIGGGSIRIHRRDVQERVFAMMGIDHDEAQEKFGFLLDAFTFGAPPHGGIAFGWDRITALLAGTDSIREVIAFPKSGGGVDPLTDAPAPITAQQRKESGIDAKPEKLDKS